MLNAYAASQVRLLCKRVTGRPEPWKRARRSGQPFWSSPAFQVHTLPCDVFAYAVLANTRYALVEGNRCCLASYAAVMALSVRHGTAWHGYHRVDGACLGGCCLICMSRDISCCAGDCRHCLRCRYLDRCLHSSGIFSGRTYVNLPREL